MFLKCNKCFTDNWFTVRYTRAPSQAERYWLQPFWWCFFSLSVYICVPLFWFPLLKVPQLIARGGSSLKSWCFIESSSVFVFLFSCGHSNEPEADDVVRTTCCPLLSLCRRWEHAASRPTWTTSQESCFAPAVTFKITILIVEGAEPRRSPISKWPKRSLFPMQLSCFNNRPQFCCCDGNPT